MFQRAYMVLQGEGDERACKRVYMVLKIIQGWFEGVQGYAECAWGLLNVFKWW